MLGNAASKHEGRLRRRTAMSGTVTNAETITVLVEQLFASNQVGCAYYQAGHIPARL